MNQIINDPTKDFSELIEKARFDFPLLTQRVRGKKVVYLDSAATSLKPWSVIERLTQFYSYETANVHRGSHFLSDVATENFEATREKVRFFLSAANREEIIFTKGATDSINLVASSWGETNLHPSDEVLITEMEHHSNIIPWQTVCKKTGAHLHIVRITDEGEIDIEDFYNKINERTKIVAITHCSNALGTINDIKPLIKKAHEYGSIVLVDGAQMVANRAVDVQDLDVDFYVFSGHKVFGPYGVGVLYGKKELLEKMPPYQTGGSMINVVEWEETSFQDIPFKFEAGTPAISSVVGLNSALDYLSKWGWDKWKKHERSLMKRAYQELTKISGVRFLGVSSKNSDHFFENRAPILSFIIDGLHPSDVGQILDQENVAVRTGHHCVQPLMRRYKVPGSIRASFSIYNNLEDIDALVRGLVKAKELLI